MSSCEYHDASATYANAYIWPLLRRVVEQRAWAERSAFDLGCGNGATCQLLSSMGFSTVGIDTSESGIAIAQANGLSCHLGSAYDDLAETYGKFQLVVSLEVIEHCVDPRAFAKTFLSLLQPGGLGFLSTPYHGYTKNLVLALTGRMDTHFTALWDGGHIKFFSIATLGQLLQEVGAPCVEFHRVGRLPVLAKSMVAVIHAPR